MRERLEAAGQIRVRALSRGGTAQLGVRKRLHILHSRLRRAGLRMGRIKRSLINAEFDLNDIGDQIMNLEATSGFTDRELSSGVDAMDEEEDERGSTEEEEEDDSVVDVDSDMDTDSDSDDDDGMDNVVPPIAVE